jgi:hypothetical protein
MSGASSPEDVALAASDATRGGAVANIALSALEPAPSRSW